MNILRPPHLGFCFGVRNALALAIECASHRPITVLGELVHNPDVLALLRQRGVQTAHEIDHVRTQDVMITAHGASVQRMATLRARGLSVWDATCPLVRAAQRTVKELAATGWHPVVVGRRDHVEVRGLTEDLADFDVVLSEADIEELPDRERFGVVAQTTQPIERVRCLVAALRNRFPRSEVRFVDTVCETTKQRRSATLRLARECEAIVVVGGANSNNTRELAAACEEQGARVHHVQSASDLRAEWFEGIETVGLTAGTSTPDHTIDEVEQQLRHLAANERGDVPALLDPPYAEEALAGLRMA